MKIWVTEFKALDAKTGELKKWCGENIHAPNFELAQEWCYTYAGHLTVVGELVMEIPCKKYTYSPDFKNTIDYEIIFNN